MSERRYIRLILPLRLEWEPCYCLDGPDTPGGVHVGDRVRVRFACKDYVGVVSETDALPEVAPERIAPVQETLTGLPPVSADEIRLWRFIAGYYLCTVGEVYKAAYPIPLLRSEEVGLRSEERRQRLLAAEEAAWKARIERLRERLAAKDAALAGKHKQTVAERLRGERAKIASELENAELRLSGLGSSELFGQGAAPVVKPVRSALWERLSPSRPLFYRASKRLEDYLAVASNCLAEGRSVLVLVPEIGLAKGLEESFRSRFGNALLVHHSEETQARRRVISGRVRSGEPCVLLGTRSSIFLPFKGLGLVIVDGEQSPFFKQTDSAPRYNARDAAVVLARLHGASVLLGSSSPSLESEYNAATGRYASADGLTEAGPVELIDISAERRKNGMLGCISRKLAALCRSGRVALVRGFEKEEEVRGAVSAVFPGEEGRFSVFTIPEASRKDLSGFDVVALLSADALFRPDDFRSDERAFQFLDALRHGTARLVVQTRNAAHQVFSLGDAGALLSERKAFRLPPYTRIVDVLLRDAAVAEGLSRRLLQLGFMATDAMLRPDGKFSVRITLGRDRSLQQKKDALCAAVKAFCKERRYNGGFAFDVDPV